MVRTQEAAAHGVRMAAFYASRLSSPNCKSVPPTVAGPLSQLCGIVLQLNDCISHVG